ncbi:NTP transferase domain-containing protein [Candidatus Parcubacteria bacterium]|nr:NTP transferase domain-containing protein [Candidatus Parcubacteria bacterium]
MKSKNTISQAVILAGGAGKRVFPLAVNQPKSMFKILGNPLIQYVIENLSKENIKDIIIIVDQNTGQIENYFGNGSKFGVKIRYIFQKKALGMANALTAAQNLVDDNFFVLNADDVFESYLIKDMIKEHAKDEADIVLSSQPVKETWKFGIIDCDSKMNVRKLVEKPKKGKEPSNLAVIGVYIMTKKIFDYYAKVGVSDEQYEKAIQKFIDKDNRVKTVKYNGFFSSYKYPWDLFVINQYFMDKIITKEFISSSASISNKSHIIGNVFIGDNAKIMENAVIKGPAYIGKNCVIGNNVLIRNYSSIGNNSVVGYSTEIKNSLIGENCWFHSSYIGDSIILDKCYIGAGTITANFRFDEKTIKVNILGKGRVDSNRDKLGVIMSDDCRTGTNVTIMPGMKIGSNSIIGPGVALDKDLDPDKIIFLKQDYIVKNNNITLDAEKKAEFRAKLLKYIK